MAELSEFDREFIKSDFVEWSGGYHPGEASEEAEAYLEEWAERYGREEFKAFLKAWGEEELAKEADTRARKALAAVKRQSSLPEYAERAKAYVKADATRRQNSLVSHGTSVNLAPPETLELSKAQWADALWVAQSILKDGADQAWLEFVVPLKGIPGCGLCDNTGTLLLKNGESRHCLCPNGRALGKVRKL